MTDLPMVSYRNLRSGKAVRSRCEGSLAGVSVRVILYGQKIPIRANIVNNSAVQTRSLSMFVRRELAAEAEAFEARRKANLHARAGVLDAGDRHAVRSYCNGRAISISFEPARGTWPSGRAWWASGRVQIWVSAGHDPLDFAYVVRHELGHIFGLAHRDMRGDPRYWPIAAKTRAYFGYASKIPLRPRAEKRARVKTSDQKLAAAEGKLREWQRKARLAGTKIAKYKRRIAALSKKSAGSGESSRRIDVKAILADPEQRRELIVRTIQATQAREGIDTTEEQAMAAYDAVMQEAKGDRDA